MMEAGSSSWMESCLFSAGCSSQSTSSCILENLMPFTCANHLLVICVSSVLITTLLIYLLIKSVSMRLLPWWLVRPISPFKLLAVLFNGSLGLLYLYDGLRLLVMNFSNPSALYPEHALINNLALGFYLSVLSFTFSVRASVLSRPFVLFLSVLEFIFAGFLCSTSVLHIIKEKLSFKAGLDALCLPGAFLLLVCGIMQLRVEEHDGDANGGLYKPLNSEDTSGLHGPAKSVTPFEAAGFFSRMSFWWLNPLLKRGYKNPLEEKDMPLSSEEDQADFQYTLFMKKLSKQKQSKPGKSPSVFWAIISCHWKDIIVSGFFALMKILTISSGPMLLNLFIKVSLGKSTFAYESYVLAVGLFLAKSLESLSQRQWYFRSRRLGLQVRSLLTAAIYKKQQRLSNIAKISHSSGEIMNYVTVDAYRIGEFPFWSHQTWTTSLQLCISLLILYNAVGLATIASLLVIVLTVMINAPLAKLQHKFQSNLMESQDGRLKAMSESLVNMKILKLYAWETHFKKVIEGLREVEYKWLSAFQLRKAYNSFIFWSSPVLVSTATFMTCYFIGVRLDASNVFTFVATLRLVQDPVRQIPDVIGVVIQARVAFDRIVKFLDAPELPDEQFRNVYSASDNLINIESCNFSWDVQLPKPTLRNINLKVKYGDKVAICGEVGSGKSTLLAAVLGEVPRTAGKIQVSGRIAYVSQSAWIQTGTVRDNILFGSQMDSRRYQETLQSCCLVKDLEMLSFGDLTQIGERGVNLSGGQKQRVQLARALYQDADVYLLDDPFSAVDAHTATKLFNEYVMGALSQKTVLLVTHQVDFLPVFDNILLMSDGEILHSASHQELSTSSIEYQELLNAHKDTAGLSNLDNLVRHQSSGKSLKDIQKSYNLSQENQAKPSDLGQIIKREEREMGDTGIKPYLLYLQQNKGYLYASLAIISQMAFIAGQITQNTWMASNVQNPAISTLKLILVYLAIGVGSMVFLLSRSFCIVALNMQTSRSLFSQLLSSLFRAPMSFFDSTPLGRILSRVSADLNIIDLDVAFSLIFSFNATMNAYSNMGVIASITWPVLFVAIPMILCAFRMQKYYLATAKELMRINGTTKSQVASHLAESISGAMTIRAFREEDRFFTKNLELIDNNAVPFFYNFAATEWLIQRLEIMCAALLSSSALVVALLPPGTFSSGFVGMALSYGLSLNMSFVFSIQNQCTIANQIISVERLDQYMHITPEAPEVLEHSRPAANWPSVGRVEIIDLRIRYRPDSPFVLHGITCTFEGGHKIGIVGRTGSGKTTLISVLFRLVEPTGGKIVIDGLDICAIGLHDLRSRFGIIPQDPVLFHGSVRYNLDPLQQFSDHQIWEVLDKCHLREAVQEKELGLDSLVVEDGSNWSMGQRQLFCLARALLRRSRILVLDEATASIDNATDAILQKTIRTEFRYSTVITVAHRIPTVMDCNAVLALRDGKLLEYDEPMKLIETEGSLFRELVREYWSHTSNSTA